ncbi:MAG TPA: glycine betaine ABC transporter substrate-binding protein [Terriglobia bacterium]|nr:glycine betaine ABC transporter substrate-binding protein [Terriglobia bacterium]
MLRLLLFIAIALSTAAAQSPAAPASGASPEVRIGSKSFTESVILGDIVTLLVQNAGAIPVHRRGLGGTRLLWNALVRGDIDIYPEYTGTISEEILARKGMSGENAMRQALAGYGIRMTASLGFNNNYALGMKKEIAKKLDIFTVSHLGRHAELVFGFSNEFMDRGDGWPGLRLRYELPQKNVFGMDHDLAYRGLASGSIHVTDLYSTDAEIDYYGLQTLEDDLHFFPVYTAVVLYRGDLEERAPNVVAALAKLEGQISEVDMIRMNGLAKIEKVPESAVAADFLSQHFSLKKGIRHENMAERLWRHTKEHLSLVSISLLAAVLMSIPLGIIAEKKSGLGQVILGFVGIVQTIPSLALLVFMIPLLGIGGPPAMVALFLYSLLPIVRNTYTGLRDIPPPLRESAEALGLSPGARLRLVELPMASREILAGIKTSAVINVGTATLGALIGAGGYGQPILTGIRLDDVGLILQGAIPAALLALLVQGLFELAELVVVPKGLRLKPSD